MTIHHFPNVLTPSEIAEFLHIDPKTVRKWLRERSLIGIQLPGGDWRVLQSDFDAFIQTHRLQPMTAASNANDTGSVSV